MPAIQTKTLCNIVVPIASYYLGQPCIRRAEFCVIYRFYSGLVFLPGIKIVRTAEIILSTSTTDGWELCISIHKEFDLTFTPPAIIMRTISYIGTYILSFTLHTIQDSIICFVR